MTTQSYALELNAEAFCTDEPRPRVRQLLELGGFVPVEQFQVYRLSSKGEELLSLDDVVDLRSINTDRFRVQSCVEPEFYVNDKLFTSSSLVVTGRDILLIAGLVETEQYDLFRKTKDGEEPVRLDERVDLRGPNSERFIADVRCGVAGELTLRRDFTLPRELEDQLEASGFVVETVLHGNQRWAVTAPVDTPDGYAPARARLAVPVPQDPLAAHDMLWVSPPLVRIDGKPPQAVAMQPGPDGTAWQRWSRHYETGWKPGVQTLATHIRTVWKWIAAEAACPKQ